MGEDNHLSISVFRKKNQIVMLRYINTDIVFQEFPDEVHVPLIFRDVRVVVRAAIAVFFGRMKVMI